MCNVNCKLHVVKCQMSSQISRSLRSQRILWDMKQCIAMLNYNQSASIVYFLNWQQMLGVFWGVGKGKCCGVGRLRGVRGTAPISLGMCGILMWDGDTQNWRPNSCLACPHTFSHQHICTCWLLLTFHGNQIYIQKHWFHCHQIHGLGSYVRRQDWIVSICYDLSSCHPPAGPLPLLRHQLVTLGALSFTPLIQQRRPTHPPAQKLYSLLWRLTESPARLWLSIESSETPTG